MSRQALNDARLISRYASARGLLPADSPLPGVIAVAHERLQTGPLTQAEEQQLNGAINGAAALIRPVTVEQLRAEQEREGRSPLIRAVLWLGWSIVGILLPTVIGLICAGLIFVIIPLTTNFNRIGVFINELKPTDAYEFFANLTEARVLQGKLSAGRDVSPPAVRTPPLAEKNAALKKKKKARPQKKAARPSPPSKEPTKSGEKSALTQTEVDKLEADLKAKAKYLQEADSRIAVNLASLHRVVDATTGAPRWYALIIQSYGLDEAFDFLLRVLRVAEPSAASQAPLDTEAITKLEIKKATDFCEALKKHEGAITTASLPGLSKDPAYGKDLCANIDYAQGIGLRVRAPGVIFAAAEARQQAESLNILLGSAILPVLYGLLGASVFLLRRAWGEDSNADRARPLNVSAFLRLALGGIAGLAIGWFWVPSAKTAGDLTTLTTTPFALAFLAGFSIELLFSILDRILGAINPSSNNPNPPQPPAAGPLPPAAGPLPPAAGSLPPAAGPLPPAAGPLPPAAGQPPAPGVVQQPPAAAVQQPPPQGAQGAVPQPQQPEQPDAAGQPPPAGPAPQPA